MRYVLCRLQGGDHAWRKHTNIKAGPKSILGWQTSSAAPPNAQTTIHFIRRGET